MRSYSNLSLRDLLDAFASTAPAPGGGSAAALAGAIGVSLLLMALGIRTSRPTESGESRELADAADRLRSLRPTIAALIDRDSGSLCLCHRRAPHACRRRRLHGAPARGATSQRCGVRPTYRWRRCARAVERCAKRLSLPRTVSRSTHGDIGVAIELLRAAVRSAGLTIDANVASLGDTDYAARVRAERERLDAESTADAEYGLVAAVRTVRLTLGQCSADLTGWKWNP